MAGSTIRCGASARTLGALRELAQTAGELLADLDAAFPEEAAAGDPMVSLTAPGASLLRAHRSLTHAVALMVDAVGGAPPWTARDGALTTTRPSPATYCLRSWRP